MVLSALVIATHAPATAATESTGRAPSRQRPNIVILYTDDQGYGDCSAFNPNAKFQTPNMDRLAREGVSFTDAHSAGSVCTPSRYALLTGRYPWRTKTMGAVLGADANCLIKDEQTTIASLLRDQGYATAAFGKWHVGMQIPGDRGDRDWTAPVTDGPLQKGFDTFFGLPASMNFGVLTWIDGDRMTAPASMWTRKKFPPAEITTRPLDYRMAPPYDATRQGKQDIEVAPGFVDGEALRIITEHTVDFIEDRAATPFLVYVAFTSPHLPHCTAPEFRGTSGMGNYGDFMVETDHRVGQVLDALDRSGVAEDTLVVLTSDNGPENNYKDWARIYDHQSNGGYRGGKRDIYEGGHRVPFIVRWPAAVSGGETSAPPIGQVDLVATVAELIGAALEPGQAEDSVSFVPALHLLSSGKRPNGKEEEPDTANDPPTYPTRAPLIHHGRGRFAIRDGRWKLIFAKNNDDPRVPGTPAELFDLDADPGEHANCVADHPDLVAALQKRAEEIVSGESSDG